MGPSLTVHGCSVCLDLLLALLHFFTETLCLSSEWKHKINILAPRVSNRIHP